MSEPSVTSRLPAWQRLSDLALRVVGTPIDAPSGTRRAEDTSLRAAGITLDLSKERIDRDVATALDALATATGVASALSALMSGATVNASEARPALHTALRAPTAEAPKSVSSLVAAERDRRLSLANDIIKGRRRGGAGRPFTDVVHIGIGGSHLGPALAVDALPAQGFRPPRIHFLSNVDGRALDEALGGLDPQTTLVAVASKSFGTLESLVNAKSVRSWFHQRCGAEYDVGKHFVAITAATDRAVEFGIPADHVLSLWDWVGGRYSLWSSVGFPIAIHLGSAGFRSLLSGAHEMDQHALTAPIARNLPIQLALVGIWNSNFLGAQSHAVLPYARALKLLPEYLQQLEMESNGKSARTDGSRVDLQTVPMLWGGEETNGQHAFHQFLHQGTRAFSVDFVATIEGEHDDHQAWLLANCFAQGEALMKGRTASSNDAVAKQRAMPGNRPSTTIVLQAIDPRTLGALLALYEHKVYCQSIIWQINAFDQWGVELGKSIGDVVFRALAGTTPEGLSPSTRRLIELVRHHRK